MDTQIIADSLQRGFHKANLRLEILDTPPRKGGENIIQIDIAQSSGNSNRKQWFTVYLGDENANISVLDTDGKKHQLLLFVHEGGNPYEVHVPTKNPGGFVLDQDQFQGEAKIVRRESSNIVVEVQAPATKRHFLLGQDDRDLFIAQLTRGVSRLDDAYKSLSSRVEFPGGKAHAPRQGEWFFVEIKREQSQAIDDYIKKDPRAILHKGVSIASHFRGRSGGKPHVADELIVYRPGAEMLPDTRIPRAQSNVYIRGKIKHADHPTRNYRYWRRVVENNEGATRVGSLTGYVD